jgi:heptosyltransferase-1
MPKILLIKTSSLGDVVHNLPVVSDIQAHYPGARIDWVVEEGFQDIPRLHPGVTELFPIALRRWRKTPLAARTREAFRLFRQRLRQEHYDLILDTQGLLKSALIATLAKGTRVGHAWGSAREPLAALAYDRGFRVDRTLHAVTRNRILAGNALGYAPQGAPDYGIRPAPLALPWLDAAPYCVLLHATSRDDKLWPEEAWVALGRALHTRGLRSVLPWGSEAERLRGERLAGAIDGAKVAPRLTIPELSVLLGGARAVIGVDTGLTHLAAALGKPVVALYCGSDPGLTGVLAGDRAVNLGARGAPPTVAEVLDILERIA